MKRLSTLFVFYLFAHIAWSQLTVATATPQQCLNTLIGINVSYNLVSSQGSMAQFGTFNGANSNIGFASGMVLSTAQITGPNTFAPPSGLLGAGTSGYPALSNLINGTTTNNASVITFQFTPIGDTIKFRYVFASEEYPVYVCSGFNDVFAFLLSGPNPNGGNYANTNIALIPNTSTPVTINNVNAGNSGGTCTPPNGSAPCPCNSQYFVNNYSPAGSTVTLNGFTTPLTAVAAVVPCSTYTITLAVADALDGALNSAVFLEANSFISPVVTLSPTASIGGVDTVLYEGCSFATVDIFRNYDIDQQVTYNLQITGTAQDGVDYTGIPQTVTFLPGDSTETITINTIDNPLSNSNSYVTITIQDTVCGANGVITSTLTLDIVNVDSLNVDIGPDLLSCDTINIPSTVTGGLAPYTYNWNNGYAASSQITNYILTGAETFVLEVSDNCNHTSWDTLNASVLNSPTANFSLSASSLHVNEECGFAEITITRTDLLNQARTYPLLISGTATPNTDFSIPNSFSFAVNQTSTTLTLAPFWDTAIEGNEYITLMTVDTLCNGTLVYDSLRITLVDIAPLSLDAGPDFSTGCPILTQNLQPSYSGGTAPYFWSWDSGQNTQNIQVQPSSSTTYVVTLTDSCSNTISGDVYVETYYPPVAGFTFTSGDWCEPALVMFTNTSQSISGTLTGYAWDLGNGEQSTDETPLSVYETDGGYIVQLVATNSYGCVDSTSQTISVRPKPIADFYWEPQSPSVNNPTVNFMDNSNDADTWAWQIDNLSGATDQNPQYTFSFPGEFDITLYITNQYGCSDTAQNTIIVTGESTLYIPSAFTPANDNLNDTFKPSLTNMKDYRMQIYNRWGELLFSTLSIEQGWNGKGQNGKLLKNDVYVYKIYVKDIYGKEFEYYGHVALMQGQ